MSRPCPCGRRVEGRAAAYGECCGPLHRREQWAETAEQLMRSRFSAFVLGQIDYLLETHRPARPDPDARRSLEQSTARWHTLQVLDTRAGGPSDQEGEVEFAAVFEEGAEEGGRAARLTERSRFQRIGGRWFYIDGSTSVTPIDRSKVGRNDPCWCGSGKKHKKCHG